MTIQNENTQLENTENKTFDMKEFLSALPVSYIRKSQTDGVTLYNGEKTLSSQGADPLNLKQLLTFIQRPIVQYNVYILNNGEPYPFKTSKEEREELGNQSYPYATLFAHEYIKPEQLSLDDKRLTLVDYDGVDVEVLKKHLGQKASNVKVNLTYPAMVLYEGALSLGLVHQGKFALWNLDLRPSQAMNRISELTKALSPKSTAKFNMETGKPEVVSAKACTAVMWDEHVMLTDPTKAADESMRGYHMVPAKSDKHGIPFIDLSESFKTPEAFQQALSSVEPLMEHPDFKEVIMRVYENSLKSLLRMRHTVETEEASVVVVEVDLSEKKKPAGTTLSKEEQELFSDDGI